MRSSASRCARRAGWSCLCWPRGTLSVGFPRSTEVGLLTSWVYNPRTQGGQEMNYGRTVDKALYWAGIDSDEWYKMAEVKGIWNKVTHGQWNGTAGI